MTDEVSTIAAKLVDFERDVLRTACGDDRMTGWGAATTEAVEHLRGLELLTRSNAPTTLGRKVGAFLANVHSEKGSS